MVSGLTLPCFKRFFSLGYQSSQVPLHLHWGAFLSGVIKKLFQVHSGLGQVRQIAIIMGLQSVRRDVGY